MPSTGVQLPTDSLNQEAARILAGLRNIEVPPPVPAKEAVLAFGQLVPDEHSRRIILGVDVGVAVIDVWGEVGSRALGMANVTGAVLPCKIALIVGKTFIAAENAADVYLIRQNQSCERALAYLKNEQTAREFAGILKDMREGKQPGSESDKGMVEAARAVLDPALGNSGMRMAWDAMLSVDARRAALTQACIELAGHAAGAALEAGVSRIAAVQQPAFREATDFLAHARVALEQVTDDAARESLRVAAAQANEMIALTYRVAEPAGRIAEHVGKVLFEWRAEEAAEVTPGGNEQR